MKSLILLTALLGCTYQPSKEFRKIVGVNPVRLEEKAFIPEGLEMPKGCFEQEARKKEQELLLGKYVIVQGDKILLKGESLDYSEYMLKNGFARFTGTNEKYRSAEAMAKIGRKGLWGLCYSMDVFR